MIEGKNFLECARGQEIKNSAKSLGLCVGVGMGLGISSTQSFPCSSKERWVDYRGNFEKFLKGQGLDLETGVPKKAGKLEDTLYVDS